MNRFSILYRDNSAKRSLFDEQDELDISDEGYNFQNILSDLNLGEISKCTTLSSKEINYVLGIASDFKSGEEDVAVRVEIIKDFLGIRDFFLNFERQMRYFVEVKAKLADAKRNMMRASADIQSETSFLNYNRIVSACYFFSLTYKTIFNLYREFKYPQIKSTKLQELGDFLIDLVENSSFKQLDEECRIFCDHVNEGVVFDTDIKMNSILRIVSLKLRDFRYIKPVQAGLFYSVMRALAIEEKAQKNKLIYIEKTFTQESLISKNDDAYLKGTIEQQINLIARRLASIYETLIDLFSNLSGELTFYKYALNMIAYMKSANIPCCLAEIAETPEGTGCFAEFSGLCDVTLAVAHGDGGSGAEVVKNDCAINENDKTNLIIGANQSGKTTFLRALGSALVFARVGLPVPAIRARLGLFANLYTHFQRYDEDLKNEGQLDTELAEMEKIVYSADQNSIILMNESFSSTGQKDAKQIACDVLSALSRVGAKVIYVTHITDMRERLREGGHLGEFEKKNINLYRTGQKDDGTPSFKIERIL
ncbi:MAG: hypothetical protein FWD23_01155 [Oscillospiraceae bacterium]|nr:hypothetical protein [Oscillospiraceae bacterium]